MTDVAARQSVDIALTLDGSNLTNNLSFVMSGIKLLDMACKNPHTGVLDLDPGTDCDKKNVRASKPTMGLPYKILHGQRDGNYVPR